MAPRTIWTLALAFVAAWLWTDTTVGAGSIRVYHMPAQKDTVGRRLPSYRYGVPPGDKSRRNPCPATTRRCRWLKPWVRASRRKEYPHPENMPPSRTSHRRWRHRSSEGRANTTLTNSPIRLYHMAARKDSIGRRVSTGRFSSSPVGTGRRNPCPLGSRRCRWMKPWIRASRSHEYPRLLVAKTTETNTTGSSSSSGGWTSLPANGSLH